MDIAAANDRSIETSFVNASGHVQTIDPQVLEALLRSLPPKTFHSILPPYLVQRGNSAVYVGIATEQVLNWRIETADGQVIQTGTSDGPTLSVPSVRHGVYSLVIFRHDEVLDRIPFLSVPERAYSGTGDRIWILAVQLYGVRSKRNWGIGDFTDLKSLLTWCAAAGAGGVGLNPMHALFDDHPEDCSPYSPNSRLYLNALYIDVESLPWLGAEFVPAHAGSLTKLREKELVDYTSVGVLKQKALEHCFRNFHRHGTDEQREDFAGFRRLKGRSLRRYACFEVLRRGNEKPWWEWPEEWRYPNDAALDEFSVGENALSVSFVEFVQWCADRQMHECRQLSEHLNLPLGLYLDVAVGVKADGFDAWNEQSAISRTLSVGAPPDILNTSGQDWGLAGFNSSGLEMRNFEPFRETLAAVMQFAGAIRLDHVLGLNRLYLVPHGNTADKGAYVRMPLEALLAVVALESGKHQCIVIGEDLGTVPDGFRDCLADWGVWSYRVMMFERDHEGVFLSPNQYPENSLVTFNTHDLPTFEGWNCGHDIKVRSSLGIDPGETHEARAHASRKLSEALNSDISFAGAVRFMTQTQSRILAIAIEDLLSIKDQANVPGTLHQHPNWRRKVPDGWKERIHLEDIKAWVGDRFHTKEET